MGQDCILRAVCNRPSRSILRNSQMPTDKSLPSRFWWRGRSPLVVCVLCEQTEACPTPDCHFDARPAWPISPAGERPGSDAPAPRTRAPKCIRMGRMQHFDRITWNPNQMNGQPCIRGMRLTVRRVVEAVAIYPNRDDLFRNYPELEPEDVRQALAFAAANLEDSAAESNAA